MHKKYQIGHQLDVFGCQISQTSNQEPLVGDQRYLCMHLLTVSCNGQVAMAGWYGQAFF